VPQPRLALEVGDRVRLREGPEGTAGLWLFQNTTPPADRAFVGMANDEQVGFWGETGAEWGLLMHTGTGKVDAAGDVSVAGALSVAGPLEVAKTGGAAARFTSQTFDNESDFEVDNLKLQLASRGRFLGEPFQFIIGYGRGGALFPTRRPRFIRLFSIDEEGNAFFAGGKGGYVVDYFVNAAGDPLERGDVVVLGRTAPVACYGTANAIPIPEVDLTEQAYDTRVCGVVADVVTQGGLPSVDEVPEDSAAEHPLARFATPGSEQRPAAVPDRRMGRMVTLGAWSWCKVDADIAPVEAGDLLTTSPTRGHAQKADRDRAAGAVLGKAMAPLAAGRGQVPVLVSLH
jgi:hypothetical protein